MSLPDGRTVWADTFDQTPDRVFTLQDVLAGAVASSLSLKYTTARRHSSPCDGSDAHAYRAYLRGRHLINRPTPTRLTHALAAFREAVDRDPQCARAWAGTAFAYRALVMTGDRDPRVMFTLARAAVARALAIDADSAEAHASRGFIEFWHDWDWAHAESSLRHAIALDDNLAEAHVALAQLLISVGRADEAAPHARQAALLDPLSPLVNTLAAGSVARTGHFDEARQRLESVLELEPDFWIALSTRGGMAIGSPDIGGPDYLQGMQDLQRASELCGGCSRVRALLGVGYARAGDRAAAEQVLAEMELRARTDYLPATSMARVHDLLGNRDRALDLLEVAYAERDFDMTSLASGQWHRLHQEPRYRALVQRMNFEGRAGVGATDPGAAMPGASSCRVVNPGPDALHEGCGGSSDDGSASTACPHPLSSYALFEGFRP